MKFDPNGSGPPVPRDHDVPTFSEVVPLRSTKISIRRSRILLPFLLTAIAVVFLLALIDDGNFDRFDQVLAYLVVAGIFLGIYIYSGIRKPWWWYLVPALMSWLLLAHAFWPYDLVFKRILPGQTGMLDAAARFPTVFTTNLFGAGLCEEALKATPTLLALVAGYAFTRAGRASTGESRGNGRLAYLVRNLALQGPLDGLLMGCAAGGAFILDETLRQFVPDIIGNVVSRTQNDAAGQLYGLAVVIPRVLQGVSGHMAWAGTFGYFIGLSARYPKRALTLLPLGYLLAAVPHAFWDSAATLPFPSVWKTLDSVVTVVVFVACLLKAKQLEIARRGADASSASILVGMPAPDAERA